MIRKLLSGFGSLKEILIQKILLGILIMIKDNHFITFFKDLLILNILIKMNPYLMIKFKFYLVIKKEIL